MHKGFLGMYVLWGLFVCALTYFAYKNSWGWGDDTSVGSAPRSIRNNPGVYRSHYGWGDSRFPGGK